MWSDIQLGVVTTFLLLITRSVVAQTGTLGLQDGFISFNTSIFSVQLVKGSQTLYSLRPRNGDGAGFNFIPSDMMEDRQGNSQYHLGDLTFRVRRVGETEWVNGDTSRARRPLSSNSISGTTMASANLSPTLPSSSLLNITRRWVVEDDQLELLFDVTNSQSFAVEVGALGTPLEFNNVRILTTILRIYLISNADFY